MRIALVEDDPQLGQLMRLWLTDQGYTCQLCETGAMFRKVLGRDSFDMVVLDWMLPDTTGDQLLRWLRDGNYKELPVIFVTARDSEDDIVAGLSLGADDYMVKPVRQAEFLARVRTVYRRVHRPLQLDEILDLPPYRVVQTARTVELHGQPVELTEKEFDIALLLFRNIGRVISRAHLFEAVWGQSAGLNTRTVDTHMSRLRTKLNFQPENGWRLNAVYNHGYRLETVDIRDAPPIASA